MRSRLVPMLALVAATVPVPGASAACRTPVDGMPADRRAAIYSCTGVRPGMAVLAFSARYGTYTVCGTSFAFRDQFGHRYLGTVGTCVLDYECLEDVVTRLLPPPLDRTARSLVCIAPGESEEESYAKRGGKEVQDVQHVPVGQVVYAVNKDGVDFALVRIDPRRRLDPSMPLYGGPARVAPAPPAPEEAFVYSANKHPFGPNARSGLLWGDASGGYVLTDTTMSTGGAVMLPDGGAVGYLGGSSRPEGYNVTLLRHAMERTSRRTGLRLSLLTAPRT